MLLDPKFSSAVLYALDVHVTSLFIPVHRVGRFVAAAVILTILASAVGELSRAYTASDGAVVRLLRMLRAGFNPSAEQTVGSWLTAAILLGCALLLLMIGALTRERVPGHWRVLGWLFVFLSLDEAVSIHERIGDGVASQIETSGYFLWAWVIPYGILALAVALLYVPFLWRLPKDTRWHVILAGTIYVGGALGVEMIEARIVDEVGSGTLNVAILAVVEEGLELIGAALFLMALLRHLARHIPFKATIISS